MLQIRPQHELHVFRGIVVAYRNDIQLLRYPAFSTTALGYISNSAQGERHVQKLPRLKTLPSLPLQFRLQKKMTSSQMFLAGGLILSLVVMAWVDFSTGLLLAFLAVGIWYGVGKGPGLKKNFETKRRQDKMAEVFPQTLGMAVQALKTGQTVPQVLEYLSRECPRP